MRMIDLALKDLSQILRDKRSLIFLVFMPLVFTVFMGFAMRPADQKDSRLPIGWINRDGGSFYSLQLKGLFEGSQVVRLVALEDEQNTVTQVRQGTLSAAIIIPPGYSASILADSPFPLKMITLETSDGSSAQAEAENAALRLLSAAKSAQIAAGLVEGSHPFPNTELRQQFLYRLTALAVQEWKNTGLSVSIDQVAGIPTPVINPYTQSSPGMIVQFTIFGLFTSSMVLVMERKNRTLQRLLTTSMTRVQIIAGHLLAMFLVVLLQQGLLVLFGQFVLKVDYLRQPLGTLLVMISLALWTASLGLLIGSLAKGEEQVILYSMACMFIFTALGGAWFPLDSSGPAFAAAGHLTPAAWAMDGFQNLIVRGLGTSSVLFPAGILCAYALAFFGAAVWQFKVE